jgi:hypothetical protein
MNQLFILFGPSTICVLTSHRSKFFSSTKNLENSKLIFLDKSIEFQNPTALVVPFCMLSIDFKALFARLYARQDTIIFYDFHLNNLYKIWPRKSTIFQFDVIDFNFFSFTADLIMMFEFPCDLLLLLEQNNSYPRSRVIIRFFLYSIDRVLRLSIPLKNDGVFDRQRWWHSVSLTSTKIGSVGMRRGPLRAIESLTDEGYGFVVVRPRTNASDRTFPGIVFFVEVRRTFIIERTNNTPILWPDTTSIQQLT